MPRNETIEYNPDDFGGEALGGNIVEAPVPVVNEDVDVATLPSEEDMLTPEQRAQLVVMEHEGINGKPEVTLAAFYASWRDLGWTIVQDPQAQDVVLGSPAEEAQPNLEQQPEV